MRLVKDICRVISPIQFLQSLKMGLKHCVGVGSFISCYTKRVASCQGIQRNVYIVTVYIATPSFA